MERGTFEKQRLQKQLFITAIQLAEIDGSAVIPTILAYKTNGVLVGYEALKQHPEEASVHEDFKIELGGIDPRTWTRDDVEVRKGEWRSAVGLTKDFIDHTISQVNSWIEARGLQRAKRIMVAEPIAMGDSEEVSANWLANYRLHVRGILKRYFDDVAFLPEPFAVFQYYRYGIRHPAIAQEQKHVALVVDFGGGTFDVSVIETTAKGDISQSGRNSKPLASASAAIGGAYINRQLARRLIFKHLAKGVDRQRIGYAISQYEKLANGQIARPELLEEDVRNFFGHYRRLLHEIESAKVALCLRIRDWRLDAEHGLALAEHVTVPRMPLRREADPIGARLDPLLLRTVFEHDVWKARLINVIRQAATRARLALDGQRIHMALLSGGSANIQWLRLLIQRDLANELPEIEILELQTEFQEIVAKGLAIECARRTYDDGVGDFKAVTYNPLYLTLAANERARETPRFKPVTDSLPTSELNGVLLPSASALANFVDIPLEWRFRLAHAPSRCLDYHFARGEWDGLDVNVLHNVDHRIHVQRDMPLHGKLWVELTVTETGSAYPRFVFQKTNRDADVPERAVDGTPFYLDMVVDDVGSAAPAYVGFDFGSTNSSYSYIERTAINTFVERGKQKDWLDLNELVGQLPYFVSNPLKRYIAETNQSRLESCGLAAIEAALTYLAYASYSEFRSLGDKKVSTIFKGFGKRSAGPLWKMFRDSQEKLGLRARFTKELQSLCKGEFYNIIDSAVDEVANYKHDRESMIDYRRVLSILGNAIRSSLGQTWIGSFENCRARRFGNGFEADFRVALGPDLPFVEVLRYTGPHAFSEEEVFLVNAESGEAISLSPLMIWQGESLAKGRERPELFLYDSQERKSQLGYVFKASSSKVSINAGHENRLGDLAAWLQKLESDDRANCFRLTGVSLRISTVPED